MSSGTGVYAGAGTRDGAGLALELGDGLGDGVGFGGGSLKHDGACAMQ